MSERDTDFEFDFFDEPDTREGSPTERTPRGEGPRGPGRPVRPPAGFTPLLRLVGLIAFAILIVVLLVFWANSCGGSGKKGSYKSYLDKVRVLATSSNGLGRQLDDLLTTPGIKAAELQPKLRGLAQQQHIDAVTADGLRPPGPLRVEQQYMVEALRFRESGLTRLADAFALAGTKTSAASAALLAEQARRLVASDVVWQDLFRDATVEELRSQGVGGVAVPDSTFTQDPDLASASAWIPVLQRIKGASSGGTPGGLHGTGLISVVALPKSQRLAPAPTENTVVATTDLGFEVTIEDTGDAQEVQVPVTLTIQQSPKSIVKKLTVDVINPGEQAKVVFKNLGPVQFATKTTVRVEVQPVPGEKNAANNSAEYPVIFSLG